MDLNYLMAKIAYTFTLNKQKRRQIRGQLDAMKICTVVENGQKRKATYKEVKGIIVNKASKSNQIEIHLPRYKSHINILYQGENNTLVIGENFIGTLNVVYCTAAKAPCYTKIGNNFRCVDLTIVMTDGGKVEIGNDCLCSRDVQIWSSDGHAIFDAKTNQIKNNRKTHLIIGDHCWLGARSTIFKKTQLPNNTIVGIGSVVTRKFTEENTAVAGNPAQVVSQNVSWDKKSIAEYLQEANIDWAE